MSLVLLVDDSRVARMSMRRLVTAVLPDAEIIEAGTVDDALVAIENQSVAIVLADYNMPGRDGLELAAELRRTAPETRVALVTANIQDAIAERARALGVTFIPKPPDAALLATFLNGGGA